MNELKQRKKRQKKVRARIFRTKDKLRLSVFRSNTNIYTQIIDDSKGKTLVSFSSKHLSGRETKGKKKSEIAGMVGMELAKKAIDKKIKKVVFDRGGYRYHGRIKALAEGARKGGLSF